MRTRLFFTALTFMALIVIASAQTTGQVNKPAGQGNAQGAAWVDANNDGVCDNYESGARQGRGQGHGQAAAAGRGHGHGKGDGIHNGRGKGQGTAAGRGQGRGDGQGRYNGRGPAFADANNDSVCDNLATAPKK